ncbi:tRNA epoxyqueuosine(34) reductase QueG [Fodinicurvata halophila]|uniref:Epoxyqueuosine reductase n=1 Tax=Fodinicurvata halophila TaxID=1419723 RepID=A0ABV8UIH8_9PROT
MIRQRALEIGFDAVGFAPADQPDTAGEHLKDFIGSGYHGDMGWIPDTYERRRHPQALWPEARSVVVLAQNYGPEDDPLEILEQPEHGAISVYARHRDYHDLVKKRLKQLARWMHEELAGDVKVFVDTAPVMEKPLAQSAGLGWQGKHTNLLSRDLGNWFFLGEVFTTLELPTDTPEVEHCGSCRACLDVCPTNAFPAPFQLDARRCISYLTIEHKGHIPEEFRKPMGNRIYGCDDCLAVCPWNKFARHTHEEKLRAREDLQAPSLAYLASLDDASFREFFSGSPIKRIGRNRFLRNVLIAIGNSGQAELIPHAEQHLHDESPLVRAMAVWALLQLLSEEDFRRLRERHVCRETDSDVQAEWSRLS